MVMMLKRGGCKCAQRIGELTVNSDQQSANIGINRAADTRHIIGGKVIAGLEWLGVAARTALADRNGKQTHAGRVVGSVIEIGGAAYGLTRQYGSIQNCA
jgi:hypothetical protein